MVKFQDSLPLTRGHRYQLLSMIQHVRALQHVPNMLVSVLMTTLRNVPFGEERTNVLKTKGPESD